MAKVAIAAPTIVINNVAVGIVPNSCKYTRGAGTSSQRTESGGGGSVVLVYSKNVATFISKVNFSMFPTDDNIALIENWKDNDNNNAISITGTVANTGQPFSKNFSNAAMTTDPDTALGADTVIELEFMGATAV